VERDVEMERYSRWRDGEIDGEIAGGIGSNVCMYI
jgi:hypothetical protein